MKLRIVAAIVGVALLTVLLVGLPLALAVERLYSSQEVLRIERAASEVRGAIDASTLGSNDPIELPTTGAIRFAAYDASGHRVAGRGPDVGDDAVRRALVGDVHDTSADGTLIVAIPVNGNERVVGALRAEKPASSVVDRTHRTWLVMAIIAAVALSIAAIIATFLARRLTRPVDALVDAAERLGAGDFSVRTHASGVDELDHLGRALDTTAERLGGLVARERAFSADASHQLRTPLAGLRLQIEHAIATSDTDGRDALAGTLEPIDRLEATVDSLLRLARGTQIDRTPLDLTRVVGELEREWHGPLAAAGRPLRVAIDRDLGAPAVSGPAVQQILHVLLENAWQHGRGVVTMNLRRMPGAIAVEVGDEGTAALDRSRIFERRNDTGHGIGLSLARTLAEAEGGRLVLEQPGPSPRFVLLLPLPDPSAAPRVRGDEHRADTL